MEENIPNNLYKFLLPGSIILAGVLISIAIIYSNGGFGGFTTGEFGRPAADIGGSLGQQEEKAISADNDAFLGDKNAPVAIVEFSDFQCPFCRSFWRDTLPLIKSEYIDTGKVKFVYRDFPLSFHAQAIPAAQGAECANEQGKFWEMHDKIFEEQEKLGGGTVNFNSYNIRNWATQIPGLDTVKWVGCFGSGKYKDEIAKDLADGTSYGVSGTPTLFINGRSVVGAQPFGAFKTIIDEEIKKLSN